MYYVMDCDTVELEEGSAALTINNNFKLAGIRLWKTGKPIPAAKIENIPKPVIIDFDVHGAPSMTPHSLEDVGIPVMSQTLSDVLMSVGVDNLELFPAILKNNQTGQTFPYQIYNVIGKASFTDSHTETPLLFRLSQSVSTLIVHESIKKRVEEIGIQDITFTQYEDVKQA